MLRSRASGAGARYAVTNSPRRYGLSLGKPSTRYASVASSATVNAAIGQRRAKATMAPATPIKAMPRPSIGTLPCRLRPASVPAIEIATTARLAASHRVQLVARRGGRTRIRSRS